MERLLVETIRRGSGFSGLLNRGSRVPWVPGNRGHPRRGRWDADDHVREIRTFHRVRDSHGFDRTHVRYPAAADQGHIWVGVPSLAPLDVGARAWWPPATFLRVNGPIKYAFRFRVNRSNPPAPTVDPGTLHFAGTTTRWTCRSILGYGSGQVGGFVRVRVATVRSAATPRKCSLQDCHCRSKPPVTIASPARRFI